MPFAGYKDFAACVAANSEKDDPEAYCAAIQREAEKVQKRTGTMTAMIALLPSEEDAQALSVPGGEPAEELHITLRYLGHIEDLSGDALVNAHKLVRDHAQNWREFEYGRIITGIAGYGILGDDDPAASILLLNGNDLNRMHRRIDDDIEFLRQRDDMFPAHFKPWIPHMTLGYGIQTGPVEKTTILFDRLRFALGDNNYDYYLTP